MRHFWHLSHWTHCRSSSSDSSSSLPWFRRLFFFFLAANSLSSCFGGPIFSFASCAALRPGLVGGLSESLGFGGSSSSVAAAAAAALLAFAFFPNALPLDDPSAALGDGSAVDISKSALSTPSTLTAFLETGFTMTLLVSSRSFPRSCDIGCGESLLVCGVGDLRPPPPRGAGLSLRFLGLLPKDGSSGTSATTFSFCLMGMVMTLEDFLGDLGDLGDFSFVFSVAAGLSSFLFFLLPGDDS
mmetsp:Transcript_15163/g.37163  ORF Transcript_15163/g.37163 Transcript_15163/m.37163 type:complete len:242 (-) Transcript_15163:2556-3281(-)